MSRISWMVAACSVAVLGVSACAGTNSDDDLAQPAAPAAQTQAAPEPAQTAPDLAGPGAPAGTYTDAQLQSFVMAAAEINPIAQTLTTATPEQRTAAATQIRGILSANNLDADTYNAIASQAQTDQALAARIAALQSTQQSAPG